MTLSVRIPQRIEQELAEYCEKNGLSKSEAVKQALDQFLSTRDIEQSPYALAKDLVTPRSDEKPSEDIARHTKRLLRERFRDKSR